MEDNRELPRKMEFNVNSALRSLLQKMSRPVGARSMKYYKIKPNVPGGWGNNTVFDRIPDVGTIVHKLHYEFEDWYDGECIFKSSLCYIVTEEAAIEISKQNLTG